MRKPISKKLRFDVFKRDGFICQYCGAHPPQVLLNVDHINPVKLGGNNHQDNLITACVACNQGKSATPLSVVPQSLTDRAIDVAEKEAQIAGYAMVMEAKRERIEDDAWRVADVLIFKASEEGLPKSQFSSIKKFIDRLGLHAVLDAAEAAQSRFPYRSGTTFRYFCGICWRLIKEPGNELRLSEDLAE